eukprot:scaffold34634_cov171-Amphora_coffeaeformis.AAC.8
MSERKRRFLQHLARATTSTTPRWNSNVRTIPRQRVLLQRSAATLSAGSMRPDSHSERILSYITTTQHGRPWRPATINPTSLSIPRYYSHDSSNCSIEEMEIRSMRARVPRLLRIPVGGFDADHWFEADDTLKWWSAQRTVESVHTSFKLLDRLVQELKVLPEEQQLVSDDLMIYFEARTVVPNMIQSWFEVWKEEVTTGNTGHETKTREKRLKWTAEMILQRMDKYAEEVPWASAFRMPGKAISCFYTATLLKPEPYNETAPFCDYLIDRLLEVIPTRDIMSVYMVNTTLDLWAKSGVPDRVKRAESLFAKACDHKVQADIVTYNTLLSVYASEGLGSKAETLLKALLQDYLHNGESTPVPAPDSISFHTVALAYANSDGGIEAAQRAEFMVQRLLDPFDDFGRLGIEVSTILFNTVILAYSRSKVPQAGDEAYRVLQGMNSIDSASPDRISYGTVMDAYSRCDRPDMAEKVFEEQVASFRKTGDENLRPGALSMTLLIQSHSRSSNARKVEKVKIILDRILELRSEGILLQDPDTWTYNIVLACMVSSEKSKDTAARAEAFVNAMKERARSGDNNARPNGWTYSELIMMFLDLRDVHKAEQYARESYEDPTIDLDIRTVARFIIAVAQQGWAQKADFWLNDLLDRCEKGDGKAPSVTLLGATVSSLYRTAKTKPEALERIEHLVKRYEDLCEAGVLMEGPDNRVYSSVIASLRIAKTKAPIKVAARALAILQKMRNAVVEDKNLARRMMPLTASYRDVLRILVSEERIHVASELLQQMFDDFRWSNASSPDAWEKANKIFRQIDDATSEVDTTGRKLLVRDKRCYSAMVDGHSW